MQYLSYLKNSFFRRPGRHLTLYAIMTCAFILPLLFSIYLDSSKFGRYQQLISESKGETYHIINVTEEDCALFADIEGLSIPYYEDGTIYVHILNDEQWKDIEMMTYYGSQLMQRIGNNSTILIRGFEYNYGHGIPDAEELKGYRIIYIFSLIIMTITAYIIKSAYQSHLNKFRTEIGTLCACGANHKQITILFTIEYFVLLLCSSISAIIISALVMKGIFTSYLEISEVKGLVWLIFRMDPINTLIYVVIYGGILFIVLFGSLKRFGRESINSLLHNDTQTWRSGTRRKRGIVCKKAPDKLLANIWRNRTNKTFRSCLYVSIPIVALFLFLFDYLSVDIDMIQKSKEYEMRLHKIVEIYGGFTQTELDFLQTVDNVDEIMCKQQNLSEVFAISSEEDSLFVDTVFIKLRDRSLHRRTAEEIKEYFDGNKYVFDDFEEKTDYAREVSKGIYLMLVFLFSASFIFILIILWIKLFDYIESSKNNVKILLTIGASKKTIYRSYIRQATVVAGIAVFFSNITSIVFMKLTLSGMEEQIAIDIPLIIAHVLTGIALVGAYILPVHTRLRNILQELR